MTVKVGKYQFTSFYFENTVTKNNFKKIRELFIDIFLHLLIGYLI